MNRTMEYMAHCLPSVSLDLLETEVSAANTARYVPSGDLVAFADAIERLIEDDLDDVVELVDSVPPDFIVSGARTSVPLDDDAERRRFVRERFRRGR